MYQSRSLAFRTFEFDSKCNVFSAQDISGQVIPAYSVQKSRFSKSQLQIARSVGHAMYDIGTIELHSYSSKMDISLHGFNTQIKVSSFSGRGSFVWQPYGRMEWGQSLGGSKMQLYDGSGRQVAAVKKGYRSSHLDILVPGDDYFIDMIVTTAAALIRQERKTVKDASHNADVVNAITAYS